MFSLDFLRVDQQLALHEMIPPYNILSVCEPLQLPITRGH